MFSLAAPGRTVFYKGERDLNGIVMDELGMKRALMRISHEIIEKNETTENLCVVGVERRGAELSQIIADNLNSLGAAVQTGTIDVTDYRDDLDKSERCEIKKGAGLNFDVSGKTVIIVDDVIYTGRTARAALEAILAAGRAKKIQLAVLIDRGHREVPIKPDFVGKNVPTAKSETIKVSVPPHEEKAQVEIIKG